MKKKRPVYITVICWVLVGLMILGACTTLLSLLTLGL